jgi:CBS domain containing-hemolysin-like protein
MKTPNISDRLTVALIALVVVLTPVVLLTLTLAFLTATGSIVSGEVTPLELIELYVLDLALLLVVGYLLYRLALRLATRELPASLDALNETESTDSREETTDRREAEPESPE